MDLKELSRAIIVGDHNRSVELAQQAIGEGIPPGDIINNGLIPGMDEQADRRYQPGRIDYSAAWLLLTFLGVFGVHRFYMGKILTGLLYLITGGLFFVGILYDFLTLNGQISELNEQG